MPRSSNRDRLLGCAEELHASRGVGGVSLRAIQAAAGLSVGSLRYHFETEADFVARCPDFTERAEDLFKKSLPHLPKRVVAFRVDLAWETILGSLARAVDLSALDPDEDVAGLIDYLADTRPNPNDA